MKTFTLLFLLTFTINSYSQNNKSDSRPQFYSDTTKIMNFIDSIFEFTKNFIDVADTREDIDKPFDSRKPASVMSNNIFTNPDSTIRYNEVNLTVGLNLPYLFKIKKEGSDFGFNLYPFIEYHLNSLKESKIDILKSGFALKGHYIFTKFYKFMPKLVVGYNDARNYKDNKWSRQGFVDFTFCFTKDKKKLWTYLLPYYEKRQIGQGNNRWLEFMYFPNVGIEYNDAYKTTNIEDIGYTYTNFYKLSATAFLLNNVFQLQSEFQWRFIIKNSAKIKDKRTRYMQLSFNFDIMRILKVDDMSIMFGIDYINGENPWSGIDYKKTLQFALKAKL